MRSIAIVVVLFAVAFAIGIETQPASPFGNICSTGGVFGVIAMSVACHVGCFIQLIAALLGIKKTNATCHKLVRSY